MSSFNPGAAEFVPRFGASVFVPGASSYAAANANWDDEVPESSPADEELSTSMSAVSVQSPSASAASAPSPASEQQQQQQQTNDSVPEPEPESAPTTDDIVDDDEPEDEIDEIDPSQYHDSRENINVVFIGHVDAGKSTISGNLLVITGQVDQRTVQKYEREAKEKNRESWFLAYVMDTNEEERIKGITTEMGRASFETLAKRYTILDTPGHKTFVPNMIMGTAQADIGVLVISARKGEFETGFDRGGQTREHALLAKTLGVEKLIVVINKMDEPSVQWSEQRYNEIIGKLTPFLRKCGFQLKKNLWFLPCSGMTGANLMEPVSKSVCPWWNEGGSLVQLLDSLPSNNRDPKAPIRIPVSGRYKEMGCTFIMGKLEVGTLSLKSKLCLMPGRKRIELISIVADEKEVEYCRPGENILLKCRGVEEEDVRVGMVLCPVKFPCSVSSEFEVQMQVTELLEHKPLITAGYEAVLHIHSVIVECQITKLLAEFDAQGRRRKRPPVYVKSNSILTCILSVEYPIAAETFASRPQLGRLTLRDEGKTIAIGKILSLVPAA